MITTGGEAEGTGPRLRAGPCRSLRRTMILWSSCCTCVRARHRWYATPSGRLEKNCTCLEPTGVRFAPTWRSTTWPNWRRSRTIQNVSSANTMPATSATSASSRLDQRARSNMRDTPDRSPQRRTLPGPAIPFHSARYPYSPECVEGSFSGLRAEGCREVAWLANEGPSEERQTRRGTGHRPGPPEEKAHRRGRWPRRQVAGSAPTRGPGCRRPPRPWWASLRTSMLSSSVCARSAAAAIIHGLARKPAPGHDRRQEAVVVRGVSGRRRPGG